MLKFYQDRIHNFTILMDLDGCSANCGFCFWQENRYDMTYDRWIKNLNRVLAHDSLKGLINTISISGGEPTIDLKKLEHVLTLIEVHKKDIKVVLNTNGFQLREALELPVFKRVVKHINLSRHSALDSNNQVVFQTRSVPSRLDISEMSSYLENNTSIDLTLNYVYDDTISIHEGNAFINLAKQLNCNVAFRRNIELGLKQSEFEKVLVGTRTNVLKSSCPVCNVSSTKINGVNVNFKYGVGETYKREELDNKPYELIFVKGNLSYDWEGKFPVALEKKADKRPYTKIETTSYAGSGCGASIPTSRVANSYSYSSSCGRSSNGC